MRLKRTACPPPHFPQVSEDCLYLNVYAPYPVPAEPLPIMIFFYGVCDTI